MLFAIVLAAFLAVTPPPTPTPVPVPAPPTLTPWQLYGVTAEDAELTPQELVAKWREDGSIDESGGVRLGLGGYFSNPLYAIWYIFGYPDDAGGMFYDGDTGLDGISVVNPTPERMEELRALAIADIVIVTSKYSWNELLRVHGEIAATMPQNPGLYGVGMGWKVTDGIVHGFGENQRETRVVVNADAKDIDRLRAEYDRRYGDMVYVKVSGPATLTGSAEAERPPVWQGGGSFYRDWRFMAAGAGFLAILLAALLVLVRYRRKRQTPSE